MLAGQLGGFLAVHVNAAAEIGALHYADGGREDIAANLRGILDEHRFLRLQVAVDGSLDNDELRANIRLDRALRADRQALRMGDRSLDAALDQQVLFGGQIALELQRWTQDGSARGY